MVNLTVNTNNSSEEKSGYKSFYGLSYLSLFLALVCIVVNLLILIKLLLKPHLWSLVIIFLSLLLISNIVYGGTELSLPFLLEIASAQDQVDFLCEVSFWPQIYHITNMSQLCMWIAFLRWNCMLQLLQSLVQINVDQEGWVHSSHVQSRWW